MNQLTPWVQSVTGPSVVPAVNIVPTQDRAPEIFVTQGVVQIIFSYIEIAQLRRHAIENVSQEYALWQDFTWINYLELSYYTKIQRITSLIPFVSDAHSFHPCLENTVYLMTEGAAFRRVGLEDHNIRAVRDSALDLIPAVSTQVPISVEWFNEWNQDRKNRCINTYPDDKVTRTIAREGSSQVDVHHLTVLHCAVREVCMDRLATADLEPLFP